MPKPSTILVVDDDAVNRKLLEHSLLADGHLLTGADDLVFVDEITLRARTSPTRLWGLAEKELV